MPNSMTEALYNLFYLVTFILLVGGALYLFLTRKRGGSQVASTPLSRETLKLAERLSGPYRLSDLEKILTELGAIGAWGVVVELGLTRIRDIAQMILGVNEVEFYSHNNGSTHNYLERYRRSVEAAGLVLRRVDNVEDVFYVKVDGAWPQIAAVLRRMVGEIYGIDDNEEIQLAVF